MRKFLIALQFLTILPVKVKGRIEAPEIGAALLYFPLVGLLIGLVLGLSAAALAFFPPFVAAALILIISIIITGGLHLDGLADTADGFYGNKSPGKILEIMKDSRLGAMGALTLFSVLILKFSLLASFSENLLWPTLILMTTFARWTQVLACFGAAYARQEGKAKYFIEFATRKELLAGFVFTLVVFCLLCQVKGLVLFFAALWPVLLCRSYIKKRLGGMTGDTIGALSEAAEVAVLFLAFIIMR